jgi:arginine repressor
MQGDLVWDEDELKRLHEAGLDEILDEYEAEPGGTAMLRMLRKLGFTVTEPSVRRDPQEAGAVGSGGSDPILSWMDRADESPFREVQGLILTVTTVAPFSILMTTKDRAGPRVAAALHGADWWEVLAGTSAGIDSVLLVTENEDCRNQVMQRLKFFQDRYGAQGEIERRPFHE